MTERRERVNKNGKKEGEWEKRKGENCRSWSVAWKGSLWSPCYWPSGPGVERPSRRSVEMVLALACCPVGSTHPESTNYIYNIAREWRRNLIFFPYATFLQLLVNVRTNTVSELKMCSWNKNLATPAAENGIY